MAPEIVTNGTNRKIFWAEQSWNINSDWLLTGTGASVSAHYQSTTGHFPGPPFY
jgi:hypothetical protein